MHLCASESAELPHYFVLRVYNLGIVLQRSRTHKLPTQLLTLNTVVPLAFAMPLFSPVTIFPSSASAIEPTQPGPPCFGEDFVRHQRQYSEAEWQTKRLTIKQLYMESKKSLKQTMATMSQEHNFHAT
jgi:Clr5 domain